VNAVLGFHRLGFSSRIIRGATAFIPDLVRLRRTPRADHGRRKSGLYYQRAVNCDILDANGRFEIDITAGCSDVADNELQFPAMQFTVTVNTILEKFISTEA
jgi:hypothetical protein